MATIPVEKKSAAPLWLIPLALLALVLGLGLWIAFDDDDVDTPDSLATYEAEVTPVQPKPTLVVLPEDDKGSSMSDTGTITSVATLDTQPVSSLEGRPVKIDDLEVVRVVGDKSFYVTNANADDSRSYFVLLDEVPTPNTPTEGRYDVTQGDNITLIGSVDKVSDADVWEKDDMVTKEELKKMRKDAIFLKAEKLESKEF